MKTVSVDGLDKMIKDQVLQSRCFLSDIDFREVSYCDLADLLRKHKIKCLSIARSDLEGADFSDLPCIKSLSFYRCNLRGASFAKVSLRKASFDGCMCSGAEFDGVDFKGASIYRSHFMDATFTDCTNLDSVHVHQTTSGLQLTCPEVGEFIAWKKCNDSSNWPAIVKLLIPADAKRSSATTRKCRASKAKVLEIRDHLGHFTKEVSSMHAISFKYRVGEFVEVEDFDENRWNECSSGIHFFITRKEAVEYGS